MAADDPWAARAGWNLTSERIGKSPAGLDLPALLDRIESEWGAPTRQCNGHAPIWINEMVRRQG